MADLETHADSIAKFYKRLSDGGVPDEVAGVCAIDLNKILITRETPEARPSKEDQQDAIAAAKEQRERDREARRTGS